MYSPQSLLFMLSLLPGAISICSMALLEFMRLDANSVIVAMQDPGLLYPLIEGVELDAGCGTFLLELGRLKAERRESFGSESLRIMRSLQERAGVRSSSRIPYSATRTLLLRIWAQIENCVPPHLSSGQKLLQLCFRWLETSPLGHGADRHYLVRLVKESRKSCKTAIDFNLQLLSFFLSGLQRSHSENPDDPYFPENLQLVLPLLDHESQPICLFAALENRSLDELLVLWSLMVAWTPVAPSRESGVHFSKSKFDGSVFPMFSFMNVFLRIAVKIGSSARKASFVPDWRVIVETMLRAVAAKLSEPGLIEDTCELLVYLLKLDVSGRSLPSLLAAGGDKNMVPVGETILSFAETVFNRNTRPGTISGASTSELEFLNVLIRTLQEDLLALKSGTGTGPMQSAMSLALPTGALEAARLASIGAKPLNVATVTSLVAPDAAAWLQPLPAPQTAFMPNQALVAPIASGYPTGQGVEVPFRNGTSFAGIQNFNNTCYLSSFLQSLFLTDGFSSQVYGFSLQKLEKTDEADFVQGAKIISGLQLLFARLLKTHHKYIEISEFIRSLPPSYRSGEQQDTTESARWIFDKIGGTEQPLVKSVFGGEMIHKTQCHGCRNITERKEVFTDLCVSVPKQAEVLGKKKVTVQSLIKRMLKPESLSGDNKYSCDTCGKKQDASRWIELTQLPNHLMLVMHKFSFDIATCDFKKETTAVHPEDGSIDLVGAKYQLYGSILHYGESAMKGHYVALGKRSGMAHDHQAQWALMDDSEVTMMSESEAMERLSGLKKPTDSAYVLFFKNTNAPQAVNPRMPQQIVDEALAIEAAAVHL